MWAHGPFIIGRRGICPEYGLRSEGYPEIKPVLRGPKLDDVFLDRDRIRTVSLSKRRRYRLIRKEPVGVEMTVKTCLRIETASKEEAVDGC